MICDSWVEKYAFRCVNEDLNTYLLYLYLLFLDCVLIDKRRIANFYETFLISTKIWQLAHFFLKSFGSKPGESEFWNDATQFVLLNISPTAAERDSKIRKTFDNDRTNKSKTLDENIGTIENCYCNRLSNFIL